MNIQIITNPSKKDFALWKEFSAKHPNGNFFQSPLAFHFFKKTDNYSPFVVFIWENNNLISLLSGVNISECGILKLVSNRTIIWGGPLIKEKRANYIDALLTQLSKVSKTSIYIEFRNLFSLTEFENTFTQHGYSFKEYLNYVVHIRNLEEQKKSISKSKLRQIRNSIKNGATIEVANSLSEVHQFYAILSKLYHNKIKKPVPSISFFENFFAQKDAGKIFLVKYRDLVIGGIVCPIFYNKVIYEWYIAGMDGIYKGIYPSVLATWAPIEYALENDMKCFDFLGAGTADSDYGVREFKSKFGGELIKMESLIL